MKKNASIWVALFVLTALLVVSLPGAVTNAYSSVTLNWSSVTTYDDGTPLTDLAGYYIYYGTSSGVYTNEINVGNVTTYTFANLPPGTYYFATTAYDTSGIQSVYSNEISGTQIGLPTVTTATITGVTATTAGGGGNVTSNGGTAITAEGVCWSTSSNPTYPGSCTSDGTSAPFVSSITGLTSDTPYYVRAYATNVVGTAYGANVSFTTSLAQYALTVNLTGTGGGTVTPDSGTLAWVGSTGTANYYQGTMVTLSALANSNSYFSGWSGACLGNGSSCPVLMSNNPEQEYAMFNLNANFSGSPQSGNNSLPVSFTDTSAGNPTSWSWTFGDGGTSTLQNPVHVYESAGSYTVSLTATGTGWTATMTQNSYINVTQCSNQPVQISGTGNAFSSIQSAFASPMLSSGEVIQAQAVPTGENLTWAENYNVTLSGGYSCDYSTNSGFTTVNGTLTISNGTLTVANLIVQ
ncbi:MAG: PKD domain-containing protein [Dissulfurispiraceae bacterium]